jgi:hypothetical protein
MALPSLRTLLLSWDQRFETEELDEFRELVAAAIHRQRKSLESEEASLSIMTFDDEEDFQGYSMHLEDRWHFTREVQSLADELAVVALFKQVELHTKRVAKKNFPAIDAKALFSIDTFKQAVPFNLEALPGFAAFDELRLLNNSVKHEGKVSPQLARAFPNWNVGAPLEGLGVVYLRLQPEVTRYVHGFVAACYATSKKFKA